MNKILPSNFEVSRNEIITTNVCSRWFSQVFFEISRERVDRFRRGLKFWHPQITARLGPATPHFSCDPRMRSWSFLFFTPTKLVFSCFLSNPSLNHRVLYIVGKVLLSRARIYVSFSLQLRGHRVRGQKRSSRDLSRTWSRWISFSSSHRVLSKYV